MEKHHVYIQLSARDDSVFVVIDPDEDGFARVVDRARLHGLARIVYADNERSRVVKKYPNARFLGKFETTPRECEKMLKYYKKTS